MYDLYCRVSVIVTLTKSLHIHGTIGIGVAIIIIGNKCKLLQSFHDVKCVSIRLE